VHEAPDEQEDMMSAQFQVDTDRIQAASGDIARISGEIDTQVSAMMARLTGLQDAWTGAASARFQALVAEWQGTQKQVRASLDSIGAVLGAAGVQYAETEAQTLRMFQ
jgi:WXG100 family type VII secretion target